MLEKRVTLLMHGADGLLWRGDPLKVTVTDLFKDLKPLGSQEVSANTIDLRLLLPFDAGQLYGVAVRAKKHRSAFLIVRRQDFIQAPDQIETDSITAQLMLVPDKPVSSNLDNGHAALESLGSPFVAPVNGFAPTAFNLLQPTAKMSFLNLEAKLRATLVDGVSLLSFVERVHHVAVDRAFLFMRAAAKEAVRLSRDFASAPGHDAPKDPVGLPDHPDSFKHTRFGEGNVQLSFSKDAVAIAGGGGANVLCHSVDVDIDLARGLQHVVEFLENNVFKPGKKTDPTLVYALLFNQGIKPLYTLALIQPAAARAAARRTVASGTRRRSRSSPPRRAGRQARQGRRSS
jgi:hypothetical protein